MVHKLFCILLLTIALPMPAAKAGGHGATIIYCELISNPKDQPKAIEHVEWFGGTLTELDNLLDYLTSNNPGHTYTCL